MDANGQPQIGFMARQLPTAATLVLEVLLLNRIWPRQSSQPAVSAFGPGLFAAISRWSSPRGRSLMVRRRVWEELGGFDEGFHPLWFEDVDFCRRVQNEVGSCTTSPKLWQNIRGGHSIPHLTVEIRRIYWYRSLLRYSAKHFRPLAACGVICAAVVVGSVLRGLPNRHIQRSFKPVAAYGRVIRLAGRCLFFGSQTLGTAVHNRALRFLFMAQNDLVSVTIVTYNSGRFIKRCLESVLAQRYPQQGDHRRRQCLHRRHRGHPGTVRRPLPGVLQRREHRLRRGAEPGHQALQRRLGADPESGRAAAAQFHSGAGGRRTDRFPRSAPCAASC